MHSEDGVVEAEVMAVNKGGAMLQVEGLRAFMPGSHYLPGQTPTEALVGQIDESTPIACWWGPDDQVTPLIGVVGQFFKKLPSERAAAEFTLLPETGHCPFDDRPDIASPALIDWLDRRWPPTA